MKEIENFNKIFSDIVKYIELDKMSVEDLEGLFKLVDGLDCKLKNSEYNWLCESLGGFKGEILSKRNAKLIEVNKEDDHDETGPNNNPRGRGGPGMR